MTQLHTIRLDPYRSGSFGERVGLEMGTMLLWPLPHDQRMTVLINLLASEIDAIAEDPDQIDAIIDMVRLHLKMKQRFETPPLQNH